jgi:hypothetical protein
LAEKSRFALKLCEHACLWSLYVSSDAGAGGFAGIPDFYQACSQSVNGILRRSGGNIMLAAMGQATGSN